MYLISDLSVILSVLGVFVLMYFLIIRLGKFFDAGCKNKKRHAKEQDVLFIPYARAEAAEKTFLRVRRLYGRGKSSRAALCEGGDDAKG